MTGQPTDESIGPRVKELRKQKGWSLSELARRAEIARSYLFRIEEGKSSPTYEKIRALASALGALPSELFGEQPPTVPTSLQQFAKEENLGSAEVQMLAQIEHRGNKPDSPEEWRAIYSVIKAMTEE
jgi:transcriptional regulator with XRE-family HTH domain